jgi:hypothetical protein
MSRMKFLLTSQEAAMNKIFDELGLVKFTHVEVSFINDYVAVMKTMAQSVDILQCENNSYMG